MLLEQTEEGQGQLLTEAGKQLDVMLGRLIHSCSYMDHSMYRPHPAQALLNLWNEGAYTRKSS